MAEGKKSFIAYSDWKETFEALPDEKAGQLIKHIFRYVSDESPETEDFVINAVFANIKNTLKRDLQKWEKQRRQRVEAGQRSAEIRRQNSTKSNERSTSVNEETRNSTVSVNDSVSVSVNEIKEDLIIHDPADEKEKAREVLNELQNNYTVVEDLQKLYKLSEDSIASNMREFVEELKVKGELFREFSEHRKHFYNWFKIKNKDLKRERR